jgi:hypothetical protein
LARNLLAQEPGRGIRQAEAACTPNINGGDVGRHTPTDSHETAEGHIGEIFRAGQKGTVCHEELHSVGVWSDDQNAPTVHVIERDGTLRTANRAERRFARRIYPELRGQLP